jgi:hypothetical protein
LTAAFAAAEPSGKLGTPPSSLMNPKVTGDFDESAAPAVPPTYVEKRWTAAFVAADVEPVSPVPAPPGLDELELELPSLPPHAPTATVSATDAIATSAR